MSKGERGFALVITLIVTALLVAIVTEFITEVYVDTTARQSYRDGQQASLLADSGITGALYLLQPPFKSTEYSSLQEKWAQPLEIAEEKGVLRVTIVEENSKLSLNHIAGPNGVFNDAYYNIAQRLFKKLSLQLDLLDAVADWVDENEEPHPGGAESLYYLSLKPPYPAKNSYLSTVEELKLVKGFKQEIFNKLQPFVTVYSDPAKAGAPININTAPKEVLMALDEQITDSVAEQILEYRKITPFKSVGDLSKVSGITGTTVQRLGTLVQPYGNIYRLKADAEVNGTTRTIETVVQINGSSKPTTLYWREY